MNSIKNNNKNDNTIRSTKKDASVTGRRGGSSAD